MDPTKTTQIPIDRATIWASEGSGSGEAYNLHSIEFGHIHMHHNPLHKSFLKVNKCEKLQAEAQRTVKEKLQAEAQRTAK